MKERKQLAQFTLETEIYDTDLDTKILELTKGADIRPTPNNALEFEIRFNKAVYSDNLFYQYPLSDKTHKLIHNTSGRASQKDIIGYVLGEQIDKITSKLEQNGMIFQSSSIIGTEVEQHHVLITFYDCDKIEFNSRKNGRPFRVRGIIPDCEYAQEQAEKALEELARKKVREAVRAAIAVNNHSLKPIPSIQLFNEIAKNLSTAPSATGDFLLNHAHIKCKWPLNIISKAKSDATTEFEDSVDCPEMIAFVYKTNGSWEIMQVNGKKHASEIVADSYSHSQTSEVLIFKDLEVLHYSLFRMAEDGIEEISKDDAAGQKGLLVSWIK